ncbi:MAG TPA: hypothetical protein VF403_17245, partial [Kofleriaceae bacterium]
GDGTDALIDKLAARGWIHHVTTGADYFSPRHAEPFLARLPSIAATMSDCDVVLYQAGADPHILDPLGGWLTTEQLQRRDEIVFATLSTVPIAWNFAGGYQVEPDGSIPKVIEIHENTARAAIAVLRYHLRQ